MDGREPDGDPLLARLRELHLAAGMPSISILARLTREQGRHRAMTRSTIQDKLAGTTAPRLEHIIALVQALDRHAREHGHDLSPEMLDLRSWRALWESVMRARAEPRQAKVKAARARIALIEAAELPQELSSAQLPEHVSAVFINLARRSRALVARQLALLERLEEGVEDPDSLANLFKLETLMNRTRRNEENLLILAGAEPEYGQSKPVPLADLLDAAASEIEQYERIALPTSPTVTILGTVVADAIKILSELLENATAFSSGNTQVRVRADVLIDDAVMIQIDDDGIGMDPTEIEAANERLSNPPVIDVSVSRRMGLIVVRLVAQRHGIRVRLRASSTGGITAQVHLPSNLFVF